MHRITIRQEPVELYKVLKFEGLASSGAEAKNVIADGQVTVNGEIELRKRRKLYANDTISFAGEQLLLVLDDDIAEEHSA